MYHREMIMWTINNIESALAVRRETAPSFEVWAKVFPARLRATFLEPIQEQDWPTLTAVARTEIAARRSDLDQMAALQQHINQRFQQADDFAALFGAGAETRQQAKQIRDNAEASAQLLNELAENQFASMMAGVMALTVARFNQQPTTSRKSAASKDTPGSIGKELLAAKRAVYQALQSADLVAAWASAGNLAGEAAALLLEKALPPVALLSARRRKAGGDSTADGRLAMQFGDLIRDLPEAIAIGRYVAWTARWHSQSKVARELLGGAQGRPIASAYQAPPLVSISSLATKPEAKDGQELTIEGVLGDVTIVHLGRKAISSAPVLDARGRSATIVIPYIKLDSCGMVPGSYVRISGLWQKSSKEVKGAPALMIDRLNLGELGRRSWGDWMRAELNQIFQTVSHNLAASFSWELGTNGAGNPLRYGVWFEPKDALKRR
jgi:hypothetical protein